MKKQNMVKRIIIAAVVLVLIGAVAAIRFGIRKPAGDPKRPNATLVQVGLPQRQTIDYTVSLTGDIISIYESNIYSRVTGNLIQEYVNIGDHVKVNQLLAIIDTTELYQTFQQAAATYENAQTTYERTKALVDKSFAPQAELDSAEAALKVAQANYETARTQLSYAHIIAPFTGFITRRFLDPGVLVNANTTNLFSLNDIDSVKVIANILEKDIPLVSTKTRALITVDAYPDTQFSGAVTRTSGALDTTTRTMAVEIDIPNKGLLLKPGMFGHLTLILQQHPNALVVPAYSILNDSTGNYVFIVNSQLAQKRKIEIGGQQDSVVEVVSGLSDSDTIVTTGQQLLKNGAQVSIQGAGQE